MSNGINGIDGDHDLSEKSALTVPNSDHSDDDDAGEFSYSSRMGEIMGDVKEGSEGAETVNEDEEEDGFVYMGVDADPTGGYREQLRDVLGPDHEEDEMEVLEVEKPPTVDAAMLAVSSQGRDASSESAASGPSRPNSVIMTPPRTSTPLLNGTSTPNGTPNGTPSKKAGARPFLHPTVSRLRSFAPTPASAGSSHSFGRQSPEPSHFSAISRSSSLANIRAAADQDAGHEREVFMWTRLRSIAEHIYANPSQKATSLLGAPPMGIPTVLAANGMICIGTSAGKTWVFDFKQTLKCICGNDASASTVAAVSALALSHDHTYLACGHVNGHILLYDLNSPQTPARTVAPTSLAAVASGRQEGHLLGSRIVSVGFIAGRHTAIVSSDDSGLSFYHSLGKVLFVTANDTLRILGKYPEDDAGDVATGHTGPLPRGPVASRRRRERKMNTTLAMAPLPLGTAPDPTDAYNVVALLTPIKLVIVGLKPSPKTWFRRHRGEEGDKGMKSRWRGTLAWWPCMHSNAPEEPAPAKKSKRTLEKEPQTSRPMLVYSWGPRLRLLRVAEAKLRQTTKNPKNGKVTEVEIGTLAFEEFGSWNAPGDVLALQWLNANQVLVLTENLLSVHDIHARKIVEESTLDSLLFVSPTLEHTVNGAYSYSHAVGDVAHSLRVYKGKVFILGQQEVQVGTLLTWADRILGFVQEGDFLSAIELTRSYYVGEAPGNKNGLPDTQEKLQEVVGTKMRELMTASARYTFSEDRMADGTHFTPDGRGVDRTSLFEDLVVTCARACVALDNFDFLFEELFQHYDDTGIASIYLLQLESFVLDGRIQYVPPRITQRLVALHAESGRPDLAEQVIWHIDPECLDINQAITLCQRHQLYDALIYVFTRALKDYVSPVVELLALIRRVQQYRKSRRDAVESGDVDPEELEAQDDAIEPVLNNAYKIYPYLSDVLTGLTYPSEEVIEESEASQAKKDAYTFLFYGRSAIWPAGDGGKLVLTAEEEGGVEPTYPYLRLLLRFDTEAFLHSLDIAFEDPYLNDEGQGISRLLIVKILLELLSHPDLPPSDMTFINIFIARNFPKYPQFIRLAPSDLQGILVSLTEDGDESTKEDRQLAAEYLLSAYTPHQSRSLLDMLEKAGFYRILRSWHRQERQWSPLLLAYAHDPDLSPMDLFQGADNVLATASRANKRILPPELVQTMLDSLPLFLHSSLAETATLFEKYAPQLHENVVEMLGPNGDSKRYAYLRQLLGPPPSSEYDLSEGIRRGPPSTKLAMPLRTLYIHLQCQENPLETITALSYLPTDFWDWPEVLRICDSTGAYDAVVWGHDRQGDAKKALDVTAEFDSRLIAQVLELIPPLADGAALRDDLHELIAKMERLARIAVMVCVVRSDPATSLSDVVPEDIWFQLLHSQIASVQTVASSLHHYTAAPADAALDRLRQLVQETFAALMTMAPSRAVSFPRLFRRLVDSPKPAAASTSGTAYTEFRAILTGMLETYRSEGDMLVIAKHLVDRDIFDTVEELVKDRARGWAPKQGVCAGCRAVLAADATAGVDESGLGVREEVVVSRTGLMYHCREGCLPPESGLGSLVAFQFAL